MYFTDRGIEELASRRAGESLDVEWLASQLRRFVDMNPGFEEPIERFATWLARLDDDGDDYDDDILDEIGDDDAQGGEVAAG